MSPADEELQNKMEKGILVEDTPDGRAFRKVFDALRKEPYSLPSHFADRVVSRVQTKSSLSKDYFWFGLGLFTFIVGAILAAMLSNFRLSFGTFQFISSYPGLIIFGAAFILMLHFLDKLLLHRGTGGQNPEPLL